MPYIMTKRSGMSLSRLEILFTSKNAFRRLLYSAAFCFFLDILFFEIPARMNDSFHFPQNIEYRIYIIFSENYS